ncbi:MAG: anti-sigma factor [Acidimicrobiaceae bacterium]|nr:anti-sigma factor [Acidimicrobiaceae bacterium]
MTDEQGPSSQGRDEPAASGDVADCEETVHRLYNFLDGELTEERRVAISSHLDGCGDCLEAVDFEAELRRVISDRCKDRVPEQLRNRIAEALHFEQSRGGS